jgi:hypothetical protein
MGEGWTAFDRLASLADRRSMLVMAGLWAAAEAVVLPVVPDVGICLLALAAPRRAGPLFAAVVVGAVAGSLVLAAWDAVSPQAVDATLLALPGIDQPMIAEAQRHVARDDVLGFAQLGAGTPLKVYSSAWLGFGGDMPGLVAGTILNRVTRIGPVLLVAAVLGRWLGPWMRRHAATTIGVYAALWILVYAILWT